MIRLADPTRIGPHLADIRQMLGISRRAAARTIAEKTGRNESSVNAQLYSWEVAPGSRYHRQPDLASLVPYLRDVLGMQLAVVEPPAPERSWPRLLDPPDDVQKVISETGTVWTRMGVGGHYWAAKGWEDGVSWAQVLRWGPVTEVKIENVGGDTHGTAR